ncbi:PDZ and LIM domain protein 7 [Brienomyrus brachyistius]|uniref:PDZ and LIM domain protein 7 n=1 Tax=Brienomyrus brachyistius TaxID=42636 RepID=UPI0020B3949D|nr:PDZ and LIM domain protein 7 [Brienomyrus brachyistius]
MSIYCVTLNGPAPWGFRLQGGKDFNMPLTVSRLTPGGKAVQAGVGVGDYVVSIGDANAEEMTHVEAQNKIRAATDALALSLSRSFASGTEQKAAPPSASNQPKYSFAPSTALNKMARPFGVGGGNTSTQAVVKPIACAPKFDLGSRASVRVLQPHNGAGNICLDVLDKGDAYIEMLPETNSRHGLRAEGAPCFIPNDRGKKRLIEDTQDWQPRTGTTQSRSFRILAQLTGTDFMQDPDDENLKKSSQTPESKPVAPSADKPNETKSAPKAPAPSTGPSCRPPWVTDPNFASRYHPDKTSTVLTQHSKPAQPTPMQNRNSILQAAQQAPSDSGRTPLCAACNKIIRGRYLVALGRSWHPEEFTCSQCKVILEEGGFFEERGSIFCTKCYDNRYAPNCAKCKKIITGEIMHALKMTYHVQCFMCAACKTPIRNQAFYMEEGEPYCERDYEKMFGTKCHGCDFKIDTGDRFLEALGYSWHDTCFVCAICQMNLEGKTFYSKKDKPLCKGHAFSPV